MWVRLKAERDTTDVFSKLIEEKSKPINNYTEIEVFNSLTLFLSSFCKFPVCGRKECNDIKRVHCMIKVCKLVILVTIVCDSDL